MMMDPMLRGRDNTKSLNKAIEKIVDINGHCDGRVVSRYMEVYKTKMQMRDIRYFFKRFLNYIKRKTILVLFIEEISYCRWLRQWQGRAWRKRTLQKIMCYNYIKYTPTSINWNWESFDSSSEIIWHLQLIHCYFALLYMKCNLKISVILEIL